MSSSLCQQVSVMLHQIAEATMKVLEVLQAHSKFTGKFSRTMWK
jgi:hypothetical protein